MCLQWFQCTQTRLVQSSSIDSDFRFPEIVKETICGLNGVFILYLRTATSVAWLEHSPTCQGQGTYIYGEWLKFYPASLVNYNCRGSYLWVEWYIYFVSWTIISTGRLMDTHPLTSCGPGWASKFCLCQIEKEIVCALNIFILYVRK